MIDFAKYAVRVGAYSHLYYLTRQSDSGMGGTNVIFSCVHITCSNPVERRIKSSTELGLCEE